jgi:hypothetical protein
MDLDYRALGNAGVWCIGRLQTDADRARVVDGLTGCAGADRAFSRSLAGLVGQLAPRWFIVRDAHAEKGLVLLQPRWAYSWLRGPMTRSELQRARREAGDRGQPRRASAESPPPCSSPRPNGTD